MNGRSLILRDGDLRMPNSHFARFGVFLTAALGSLACVASAPLQAEPALRTGQVRVVYAEPKEGKHLAIRDAMQERRILEQLRTLEVKGCDGKVDAYYGEDIATLCYEYVELIEKHAPKVATPGGVTRADTV